MCLQMSKPREILLRVLELYKGMPCLWDRSHKDYKNKHSRHEANSVLLKAYKDLDENATIHTLRKKISNLRTNYYRELKKVKRNGPSYVPSLFYYDALSFLCEFCDTQSGDTFDSHEDYLDTDIGEIEVSEWPSSNEESDNSQSNDSTSAPPPSKRLRKTKPHFAKTHEQHSAKIHEAAEASEKVTMRDQEFEILGKSIGLQLRDLNKKQLTITQKLISDVIYYAKLGRLSENSSISLGNLPSETFESPSASHSHFVALPNANKLTPQSVTSSTPKRYEITDPSGLRFSQSLTRSLQSSDPLIKTDPDIHIQNESLSDCTAEYDLKVDYE